MLVQSLRSICLLLIALAFYPLTAGAEEEAADGEAPLAEVHYVPLKPAFVTNYQAAKLRYFKADVTVKVRGTTTAEAIDRHLPYIRHNLVMLFSSQSGDALNSIEGKHKLQEDAMNQVIAVLNEENEASDVEDILFTSFIVE